MPEDEKMKNEMGSDPPAGPGGEKPEIMQEEEEEFQEEPGKTPPMMEKPKLGKDSPSMEGKLDRILALLERLFEEEEETEPEEPGFMEEEAQPEMAEPSSIAAQLNKIAQQNNELQRVVVQQNKAMQFMSSEIKDLRGKSNVETFSAELTEICNGDTNAIATHRAVLEKFSDDTNRKVYLEGLKVQYAEWPVHPATQFAADFQVEKQNVVLKKYLDKSPRERQFAQQAYQNYVDSVNNPDSDAARHFATTHPDIDRFVSFCVEMETMTPGYMKKMTI